MAKMTLRGDIQSHGGSGAPVQSFTSAFVCMQWSAQIMRCTLQSVVFPNWQQSAQTWVISPPVLHACTASLDRCAPDAHTVQHKPHYSEDNGSVYSHHNPCICRGGSQARPSKKVDSGTHCVLLLLLLVSWREREALLAYPTYAARSEVPSENHRF